MSWKKICGRNQEKTMPRKSKKRRKGGKRVKGEWGRRGRQGGL